MSPETTATDDGAPESSAETAVASGENQPDGVDVSEIIIATDPNTEGEATATYLLRMLKDFPGLSMTRLASGLPMGSDLEFADELTLGRALSGRRILA